jgi:hypothetical protein
MFYPATIPRPGIGLLLSTSLAKPGAACKVTTRNDIRGGQPRLFAGAVGIEHVLVNGVEVVTKAYTGALLGTCCTPVGIPATIPDSRR